MEIQNNNNNENEQQSQIEMERAMKIKNVQKSIDEMESKPKLHFLVMGIPKSGQTTIVQRFVRVPFATITENDLNLPLYNNQKKIIDDHHANQDGMENEKEKDLQIFIRDLSKNGMKIGRLIAMDGIVLVYNVTDPDAKEKLKQYYNESIVNLKHFRSDIPIVVAANKADCNSPNSSIQENDSTVIKNYESVQEWCRSKQIKTHLLTSATYDLNIDKLFEELIKQSKEYRSVVPKQPNPCKVQ
ncbi:Ras GTPase [Heterostelium album PN500]|uniref:Ras GTPase n=1 Tax=Heterostelium pallidum (strain ATCC 26659 / Pp 5 / PN500) TaxID=670386 RepID=D3AYV4_HETP5|nr:Ras GTPase [Heterostelium album PN500]EFA85644.1 Ras GTPase [Heterostelium album PN500]|eukprot:XP_020437751.1 Ras GTPase [Heterostelium album PN500]